MSPRFVLILFAASAVAAAPAAVWSQDASAAPQAEQRELESMFLEYQRIHVQLEEIQTKALQDPEISAAQAELDAEIQRAIEDRDPAIRERVARAAVLESESHSAQQSGDTARVDQLTAESREIQQQIVAVQQEVVSEPEIASKIMTFQQRLQQKMLELNPETRDLIARFQELGAHLQDAAVTGA